VCAARAEQRRGPNHVFDVTVAAAYTATAADVAAADEARVPKSNFRSAYRNRPAAQSVTVCWFDSANDAFAPGVNRIEEMISADGSWQLFVRGRQDSTPAAPVASAS
jgi:hypothetical protein